MGQKPEFATLKQVLAHLVDQLYEAEEERTRKGRKPRLWTERVEVEMKVLASHGGKGELNFQFLGAEYGGKTENVSTLKIILSPIPLAASFVPPSGIPVDQPAKEWASPVFPGGFKLRPANAYVPLYSPYEE